MFYLADFSVIRPEPGLFVWSVIIFVVFWILIARFAFKPIAKALKNREEEIQNSLDEAYKAREEMKNLNVENEKMLAEAREERLKMLNEAKILGDKLITDSKKNAKTEARKIVEKATEDIESLRTEALMDVKKQMGEIALDIAEKVVRKELSKDENQKEYIDSMIDDLNLN